MFESRAATPEERRAFYETGEGPKGVWYPLQDGDRRSASFACPTCGKWGALLDHDITADGMMADSVVCPYYCGFHEMVTLLGWAAHL